MLRGFKEKVPQPLTHFLGRHYEGPHTTWENGEQMNHILVHQTLLAKEIVARCKRPIGLNGALKNVPSPTFGLNEALRRSLDDQPGASSGHRAHFCSRSFSAY